MITLNNKQFARNEKEFTDSLFSTGGTCAGYYRKNKKSITIMNHKKEKISVINCNNVLCLATPMIDITGNKEDTGLWWYSYGIHKIFGNYSSNQQHDDISKIIAEHINSN